MKMCKNSNLSKNSQANLKNSLIFALTIGTVCLLAAKRDGLAIFLWASYLQAPTIIHAMGAIAFASSHVHYYIDRHIYKLSNPISRKHISPLLISK